MSLKTTSTKTKKASIIKIPKRCWVATEIKGGWRLKLAYGPKDYNLKGLVLKTMTQVEDIAGSINTVFVHLKDSKFSAK